MRTPESRSFSGSKRPKKPKKRPSLIEAGSILTILATLGLSSKDALKTKPAEPHPSGAPATEIIKPPSSKKIVDSKNEVADRSDSTRKNEMTDEERAQRLITTLERHLRTLFPKIRQDTPEDVTWGQTYQRPNDVSTELSIVRRSTSAGSFHYLDARVHDGT